MKKAVLFALCSILNGCTRYAPRAPRALTIYTKQVNAVLAGNWLVDYDANPSVALRNSLISKFVFNINGNYETFKVRLYANQATGDIVGDFLGLGLGGAAVLTGSAHAKTVLALVAATVLGGKASIDAHWTENLSRSAIVSEMDNLRNLQMAVIENGMASPLAAYSLDQGIIDAQTYYQAGSVVAAIQAINQTAQAQQAASKEGLRQTRMAIAATKK